MGFGSPKRGMLEILILLVVFIGMLIFLVTSYAKEKSIAREQLLMGELNMLRSGLELYTVIEHKRPESIVELCSSKFKLPEQDRNQGYVEVSRIRVDDKGQIIDPYGNPYSYDKDKMWIASTTRGYEAW